MTDRALAGEFGPVVCLEAPEPIPVPASLRPAALRARAGSRTRPETGQAKQRGLKQADRRSLPKTRLDHAYMAAALNLRK